MNCQLVHIVPPRRPIRRIRYHSYARPGRPTVLQWVATAATGYNTRPAASSGLQPSAGRAWCDRDWMRSTPT